MKITIARIIRRTHEGISKKTGKPYSFESMSIAPLEDVLMDINGDEFARDGRWLGGKTVKGVTENWVEGDQVKINLVRRKYQKKDGSGEAEGIDFALPEGIDPMVKKYAPSSGSEPTIDHDDF